MRLAEESCIALLGNLFCGLGFGVLDLRFSVWGLKVGVRSLGFRAWRFILAIGDPGFRMRVKGLVLRV